MAKTVTSIKVDEDTWKKVRIEAINQDKQLSDILAEALESWLKMQKGVKK